MGMRCSPGIWMRRMKGIHAVWLLLFMFVSVPLLEAAESKRVAFVIGIGTYDNLSADKQLKNPINDADGVSAKLTEVGFQVTKAQNLTRSGFNEKWQNVLDSLGKDDTFVLFFSGHGVQIDGHNYLLARDIPFIQFGRQTQLTKEAISLDELLLDVTTGDRLHPKNSVVILDACRDNPLIPPGHSKGTAVHGGLAKVSESQGIFIMYSASSNRTALDRLSPTDSTPYSVFTRVLLPLIGRRDLRIQDVGILVKDSVWKASRSVSQEQLPTYYDGILGRLCLPGCKDETDKYKVGLNESGSAITEITDKIKLTKFEKAIIESKGDAAVMTGKDGAPMVLVPEGKFIMGSKEVNERVQSDEQPNHQVYLDAYYIDQYEVTTSRYAKFLQETKRTAPKRWSSNVLKLHGSKPVVGVTWRDAAAYCSWSGKRLPSEAEWEKAARGIDQQIFPWGNNELNQEFANFGHCCDFESYGSLTDVGSFEKGKSPYGVYDMAGNVWEWTADWYDSHYYEKSPELSPKGPPNGKFRVLRGGSWNTSPKTIRSTYRTSFKPTTWSGGIGFRCAQDTK